MLVKQHVRIASFDEDFDKSDSDAIARSSTVVCRVVPAKNKTIIAVSVVLLCISLVAPHLFSPLLISWVSVVCLAPAVTVTLTALARPSGIDFTLLWWNFLMGWFVLAPCMLAVSMFVYTTNTAAITQTAQYYLADTLLLTSITFALCDALKMSFWMYLDTPSVSHPDPESRTQITFNAIYTGLGLSSSIIYFVLSSALVSAGYTARATEVLVVSGLCTALLLPLEVVSCYLMSLALHCYFQGLSVLYRSEITLTHSRRRSSLARWLFAAWFMRVCFVWSFGSALTSPVFRTTYIFFYGALSVGSLVFAFVLVYIAALAQYTRPYVSVPVDPKAADMFIEDA